MELENAMVQSIEYLERAYKTIEEEHAAFSGIIEELENRQSNLMPGNAAYEKIDESITDCQDKLQEFEDMMWELDEAVKHCKAAQNIASNSELPKEHSKYLCGVPIEGKPLYTYNELEELTKDCKDLESVAAVLDGLKVSYEWGKYNPVTDEGGDPYIEAEISDYSWEIQGAYWHLPMNGNGMYMTWNLWD